MKQEALLSLGKVLLEKKLFGFDNLYKIKLRSLGYRLAYQVKDDVIVVYVLSVGKREKNQVYNNLANRLD